MKHLFPLVIKGKQRISNKFWNGKEGSEMFSNFQKYHLCNLGCFVSNHNSLHLADPSAKCRISFLEWDATGSGLKGLFPKWKIHQLVLLLFLGKYWCIWEDCSSRIGNQLNSLTHENRKQSYEQTYKSCGIPDEIIDCVFPKNMINSLKNMNNSLTSF